MEEKISSEKNAEDPPDSSPFLKGKISFSLKESPKSSGPFFIVEIVSDIERCKTLWQEFSPQKNLFDTWEFRYAFYKGYEFKPYFLLLKNENENLSLLPLWFDKDEKNMFGSVAPGRKR